MAAQVFTDDILGPFGTSEKVVYLENFFVVANNIQVADKFLNVPPTKSVPGKYWTKPTTGLPALAD